MIEKNLFPPGLEPGTFRVLGERDNHYTTETWMYSIKMKYILQFHVYLTV